MEYYKKNKFAHPVDKAIVEVDWRARGYSCNWFIDPPGQQWNDFVHGCNELVTVVEGSLEMTIEGESRILNPGDEAYIPMGSVHSVRNIHRGTTRWLYGYD